jgi:chemosensory pili system protein ChpA (sensor histidine kinase/response regulator)
VAIDIPLELDSGPIVWVKPELDASLLSAIERIGKLQDGSSGAEVSAVRADMHKIAGAFELVGAEGLAVVVREFESHFPDSPEIARGESLQIVASACRRLIGHLEEIAAGAAPVPMRFLPEYLALGKLRGVAFGPADLFFPDLSRKPPKAPGVEPVAPTNLPSYLLRLRRDFQRGLLEWLRGSSEGLVIMERALSAIQAAYPLPAQRAFWWSSAALMVAIRTGGVESSSSIKQLFARIDLQIRRLVEGSTKVADRLKREVLYHVARATVSTPEVDQVRELYELDTLVPRRVRREIDVVGLRPAITALSANVARCKEDWAAVSMNRSGAIERLLQSVGELPDACKPIEIASLSELASGLAAAVPLISAKSLSEDTSLEFASSLLLLETAIEHLAALPASFPTQVENALKRLSYATSRAPIPEELRDGEMVSSLTRQAQERETVTQVCREIRTNMRQVEGALDAVFRDAKATEELAQVPAALSQVSGALRMLGWNDAHGLLNESSTRLVALAESGKAADPKEIELLANVLAGFGFYIDVRERRGAGADVIVDSLSRLLHAEGGVAPVMTQEESVESALSTRIRSLKVSYHAYVGEPQNDSRTAMVRSALDDIARDAELVYNADLSKAAKAASAAMGARPIDAALLASQLSLVLGETVEVPAISFETQKLLDTPIESHDTALLEIFTEEAREVVTNITAAHADYLVNPGNATLIKDIRRGFHTLKGSGRMVGQATLGAAAWDVESVLNHVIEEERTPTIHELELVRVAAGRFDVWVTELESKKPVSVPAAPFAEWVAKCVPAGETAPTKHESAAAPSSSVIAPAFAAGAALAATAAVAASANSPESLAPETPSITAQEPASIGALDDFALLDWATTPSDDSTKKVEPVADAPTTSDLSTFDFALADFDLKPTAIAAAPVSPVIELPTAPLDEDFFKTSTLGFVAAAGTVAAAPFASVPAQAVDMPALEDVIEMPPAPAFEVTAAPLGLTDAELAELSALESAFAQPPAPVQNLGTPDAFAFDSKQWDDEVEVEGVRLSRTLFSIMSDEARAHLQTLDQELSLMLFDTGMLPSDSMVRAAHTLCGIHRTAGFQTVGHFAGLLEDTLIAIRHTRRPSDGLALVSDSIQALHIAVLRIQARLPLPESDKQEVARLSDRLERFVEETGGRRGGSDIEAASVLHDDVEPVLVDVPQAIEDKHDVASMFAAAAPVADPVVGVAAFAPLTETESVALFATAPAVEPSIAPLIVAPPVEEPPIAVSAVPPPAPTPAALPASDVKAVEATPIASPLMPTTMVSAVSIAALAAAAVAPRFESTPPALAAGIEQDPLIGIADDIDVQVLPIFLEEAQELFPAASGQLRAWRSNPSSQPELDGLKRNLHTLKGSARMAGAMRLGELTHVLETSLTEKHGEWQSADLDHLEEQFDDIAFVLDALISGQHDVVLPRFVKAAAAAEAAEASAVVADTTADRVGAQPSAAESAVTAAAAEAAAPSLAAQLLAQTKADVTAGAITPTQPAVQLAVAPEGGVSYLRVRSDAVEMLSDESGEISINRSRIESELRGLKAGLIDLTSFVVRLRGQLREIEIQGESQIQSRLDQESDFDPLEFDRYTRFQELTRGLAEGVNDVATVQQTLLKNIADAETALAAQTRLSRSVQLRLQSLRTVPFSSVSERLYRVLRQTAKDLGKRANLEIVGGRIEMDRGVLERLVPVLEHLVRNSLAHGIEVAAVREAAGKPPIGEINVGVRQQGNEVVIAFSDDGAGISAARVRAKAIATGLLEGNREVSDAQIIEFIFRSGFTTADQVTAIAGRGVGMDVVRSELAALGGRVSVATQSGNGSTFTLSVPLTLAVTQVLLLKAGASTYGIPSSLIETVRQVPSAERNAAVSTQQIQAGNKAIPFRSLASLLNTRSDTDPHQRSFSVAILRAGDATVAVEIESVVGNQEVVAKPYGPQLARVPGMAGLTVLGDGTIALLIDPIALAFAKLPDLAQAASDGVATPVTAPAAKPAEVAPVAIAVPSAKSSETKSTAKGASPSTVETPASKSAAPVVAAPAPVVAPPVAAPPAVVARLPIVLVVDDSLTVRKITSRLLEREGYKALTAKDGLDALQVLSGVNPDVILLDIEMPRMDGFEFAKTLKADNRQNMIPIIMITSRTAEKHRNHAMEIGVNEYIGKPYQDDELMALVTRYTAHVVRPS